MRLVRRQSTISGWGVYALHPLEEDTHIVEYKGELARQAEAWRREQRYLPRQLWIVKVTAAVPSPPGMHQLWLPLVAVS